MNVTEAKQIKDRRFEGINNNFDFKAIEYASDADRLEDFRMITQMASAVCPEITIGHVEIVLRCKHLVSEFKMLTGRLPITQERIDEKCGDDLTYGVLGELILTEMMQIEQEIEKATKVIDTTEDGRILTGGVMSVDSNTYERIISK